MVRKKIWVVGFPRSGHHFLINTISFNYDYDNLELSIPEKYKPCNFFKKYEKHPDLRRIIKTHYYFSKVKNNFEYIKNNFVIFNIIRDGRDSLTSCLNYYKLNTIRRKTTLIIRGYGEKGDFHKGTSEDNLVSAWSDHILSWINQDTHVIRYEELVYDFNNVVKKIGDILEKPHPKKIRKPSLSDYCYCPWKGIVGNWKNYFTKEDEEFFMKYGGETLRKLGYE